MWVASSDYNEDIRISKEILARLSEAYRKIRNTTRFILSNLFDFNPDSDRVAYKDLRMIDKWALCHLEGVLLDVKKAYESFEFYKAYKSVYDFCNEELSMYYLDMIKGRLYTYAANSGERRAAQTVIYEILNVLVRMIAPILVFTAEEIWQHMPKEEKDSSVVSVHLLEWSFFRYRKESSLDESVDSKNIEGIFSLILDVAKTLEDIRQKGEIGSSFDAKIKVLTNNEERYKFLTSLKTDLCEIFKVSQVDVQYSNADSIVAEKADGAKCVRCWNYSEAVGKDKNHPLICDKCLTAIGGN
jgi:isoleucyl-tRNA synthetase